jgi:predicted nucleic acid-binding protein
LLDTNVLVAAIKNPRKQTHTLRLLVRIIEDPNIRLVADELLVEEMLRYAELLRSPTAATIVAALLGKTSLVTVSQNYRTICRAYVKTPNKADVLHAAACLQTGAVMISNDHHFNRVGDEEIIKVWSIADAVKNLHR